MRIPFVQQMEAVKCGAARLTMILRGFGHHAELSELREACGVSQTGTHEAMKKQPGPCKTLVEAQLA